MMNASIVAAIYATVIAVLFLAVCVRGLGDAETRLHFRAPVSGVTGRLRQGRRLAFKSMLASVRRRSLKPAWRLMVGLVF
jgi:hypothetical protein